MKRVLFFIESLAGGGAEKVLSDVVANLDKSEYDVTVSTITNSGIYVEKVNSCVNYRSFLNDEDYQAGGFRKIIYWFKIKAIYSLPPEWVYRWMIHDRYDIEISFVEGFATKLIAASRNKESQKYAWVHIDMKKNPYAENSYRNHRVHTNTYERFKKICCVSQSVKCVFNQLFFDDDRVVVQYNPVDSVEIQNKGTEPIEICSNKTLQLGTIGRLEHQKGFIRLIDAVGKLKGKGYDFCLWIIGEGSQRSKLELLIEKYSLHENVKLLGFQANPYKYMSKCDAFICSSYAEGFSTAATEALILGKPVFTTECAGMRELFGKEKCGEIVPNTDEDLMEMLEKLLSGEWQSEHFKDAVARRAKAFDIKIRMQEIETLLNG